MGMNETKCRKKETKGIQNEKKKERKKEKIMSNTKNTIYIYIYNTYFQY